MRPADKAVGRKCESLLHGDIKAELVKLPAGYFIALPAGVDDALEGVAQQWAVNIDEIAENVSLGF